MKKSYLELLKCIFCGEALKISHIVEDSDQEIEWGNLECTSCINKYPIAFGIPILKAPDSHLDVKKHKIRDNLVKRGPKVKELVTGIESGEIQKIECTLLTPRLRRTKYHKKTQLDGSVNNSLSRRLPKYLAEKINWNFYYFIKWLIAKFSFEDLRRRKQEMKIFHQLKREKTALAFLKHYFLQHNQMDEYYYYYAYRFSQPRYLAGISLINMFPLSQKPILDLACGAGHKMHYLTTIKKQQQCIGLDRDFVSLYVAKKFIAPKGEYICAEADVPLPFANETFSGVLCSDAFQYFSFRLPTAREMKRVVKKDGVIILTRIANTLVYPMEGPEQISPDQLKNLFHEMPNTVVGEDMILKRYVQKLGPDLSVGKEIGELNRMMHLSLIASNRDDIFIDHGLFDDWPHVAGNLQLNPLYRENGDDEFGNTTYNFEFPSEWYEFENKSWLEHAPEQITLKSSVKEAIKNSTKSPEVDELIDNFIVLGMPDNYL